MSTGGEGVAAKSVHHYFVDESGDLALFDRRKRVLVGQPGVSNTFIVGAALILDTNRLADDLTELRRRLQMDPFFKSAPSMQSSAHKTALAFHAKDDLPEVRVEVFRLLLGFDIKIFAAFRRKIRMAEDFRAHFDRTGVKLDAESVYEQLVLNIFKDRLHVAHENRIVFARRGQSDRTTALRHAISLAKERFEKRWRKGVDRPTEIVSSFPHEYAGLQAVDYFLWALQRFLGGREARFFEAVRNRFALIVDVDDTRNHPYGEYYTSRNPLEQERMMPVTLARSE